MKKAIVMTLCAAMALGDRISFYSICCGGRYCSDDAIKKAADEGWELLLYRRILQSMVRSPGHRR